MAAAPKKRATTRRAPAKQTVAPEAEEGTPLAHEDEAVAEEAPAEAPAAVPETIVVYNGEPPAPKRPTCANCERTSVVTTDFGWAENVHYCNICLPRHLRYLLA